jgi:S1-C subfamily serine protease
VSGRYVGVFGLLAVLSWGTASHALPLQELTSVTQGSVVHLSVRDDRGKEQSSGSGFVFARDGRVATNYHVVHGAPSIVAVFPDKRETKVSGVWAFDELIDLAVLQLEPGNYAALTLSKKPAQEGEDVVLIGSPLGLGSSVSTGIVSAFREQGVQNEHFTEKELKSWALQITAAAAPGSSGSPILRSDGEVIGVLVGRLSGLDGAHFGIAVEKLRQLSASSKGLPLPLSAATGVRSVKTNLLLSGGLLLAVVVVWLSVSAVQSRRRAASVTVRN